MATYWENSCSFGLRYASWYKCLIVSLVFSHLGFWSGNLFLIAPFPDLCLLVPFLSLLTSTASPVLHILTGILPVEAMVHKRILALFGSICRLNEDSVEKRLCRRQMSVKSYTSHSWFIIVKELLIKYDLDSPFSLLESKLSKPKWRYRVAKAVNSYCVERLTCEAGLYTTLKNMNCSIYDSWDDQPIR